MNLRALRMFVTTAESGGLGRACTKLNLSQPAASRQIQTLEAEFGVALFHRVGRQLQLTSAGEDLLRQSRRLLADADVLSEQARALKEGRKGTLKVSATPQLMTTFLTSFLPRYRRHHPGIDVKLIERAAARQPSQLETGEVDLAITAPGDPRFPGRLLFPLYVQKRIASPAVRSSTSGSSPMSRYWRCRRISAPAPVSMPLARSRISCRASASNARPLTRWSAWRRSIMASRSCRR